MKHSLYLAIGATVVCTVMSFYLILDKVGMRGLAELSGFIVASYLIGLAVVSLLDIAGIKAGQHY